VKAVIETKRPVKEPVKEGKSFGRKSSSKQETSAGSDYYSVSKIVGNKLTGQTIDCLSLINRKEKKKSLKLLLISLVRPGAGAANKNKRKRIAPKPSTQTSWVPGAPNPNKITPNVGGGGFNANRVKTWIRKRK
jgi:translation initiation factor IF-2